MHIKGRVEAPAIEQLTAAIHHGAEMSGHHITVMRPPLMKSSQSIVFE